MTGTPWLSIALAVVVAAAANSISAIWATQQKLSWLIAMLAISPFVFITFGLVAKKTGLAVAAGTTDALLTVVTMAIGLVLFREWSRTSPVQLVGMALAVAGVCLMLFFPRAGLPK